MQRHLNRLEEVTHKNLMKLKKKNAKSKSYLLGYELETNGSGSSSALKTLGILADDKQRDQQPPGLNEQEQNWKTQDSDHPSSR